MENVTHKEYVKGVYSIEVELMPVENDGQIVSYKVKDSAGNIKNITVDEFKANYKLQD